jgi:hypothetical protein
MTNETQTIQITMPANLEVEFRDEIGTKLVSLSNKSAEWLQWALANGLRQSIADAIAGKAGTEDGKKAIEAKFERVCVQGQIPSGGGGGARLTPEVAGWIEYFKSKDAPVKFKGKVPSRNTLDEYLEALTKKAIQGSIRAKLEGLDKDAQIQFHKEQVPLMIEKALPKLREREEALTQKGTPGWYIQVEKDKRAGKATQDSGVAPLDLDF